MHIRDITPFVFFLLAAPSPVEGQAALPVSELSAAPEPSKLLNRVISNQKKDEAALDLYERLERLEMRKNASDAVPAAVKIARVIPSGTGMDKIPVNADGHPSDAEAYRARLESLEHALALIVTNHRSQRDALEKYAKKKKERDDLMDAARKAFDFTFLVREAHGGRLLAKYEMTPNRAFKPNSRLASIFPKVHGYVWIDEDAGELARIEGDVTEDISIALFLGKIYKGSHFMQERYEVLPGLWQASFSQYDFDGRKFFSAFSMHQRTFYSHYRYIGPPREAIEAIRKELERGDLNKADSATADPRGMPPKRKTKD